MEQRLAQVLLLETAIKAWEQIDHDTSDDTYYTALYKMQLALRAVKAECHNYRNKAKEKIKRHRHA